jgi:hypothetical protein
MDRCVLVHRCKRTGAFLLNPASTRRGASTAINLWEVLADATNESLGRTVIDLLAVSGRADPTADASREEETERLWRRYGMTGSMPTLARRFLLGSVEHRHGRKSWVVQVLCYDAGGRVISGEGQPLQRVRQLAGAAALGVALRTALDLPQPRRNRHSILTAAARRLSQVSGSSGRRGR